METSSKPKTDSEIARGYYEAPLPTTSLPGLLIDTLYCRPILPLRHSQILMIRVCQCRSGY